MERRDDTRARHDVVIAITDGVALADIGIPLEVFGHAVTDTDPSPYRIRVASQRATVDAGEVQVRAPWRLDVLDEADTIIVPGVADGSAPAPRPLLDALRRAADRGARIASICVGSFVLAEAGLLDGRRAATHWAFADDLRKCFPDVEVDASVLYVDTGAILTSAGASAAFDLCLHMVRSDFGSRAAARTAREVVMPMERTGGQAQFISHEPPRATEPDLAGVLAWLDEHHRERITIDDIAQAGAMSRRTLHRRFAEQLGTTPTHWLRTLRIRRACGLLESTELSIDAIAHDVGITSATTFRSNFVDLVGVSPTAYRTSFAHSSSVPPRQRHDEMPRGDARGRQAGTGLTASRAPMPGRFVR